MLSGELAILYLLFAATSLDHAIVLFRERNFAAAEAELRDLIAKKQDVSTARLYLVRTLLEQNRIPDALAELDQTLGESKDPEQLFQAGQIARKLAEQRFQDLNNAAPGSAAVLEFAGRQFEMSGRNEEALEKYRAAAALNPNRPGIHYKIGNSLWRLRRLDDAKKELNIELAASPYHAMANLRLGQVLLAENEAVQAVAPLEKAVQAMAQSTEARKELGKAYRKADRIADARREWETVAKERPSDDQIHFLLGTLYRELGDENLARRELARHREILESRRALAEKK